MTYAVPGLVVDVFLVAALAIPALLLLWAAHGRDHRGCGHSFVRCVVRRERSAWRIVNRPPYDWSAEDEDA